MSTSLQAAFNVVFGNVYFVTVILNIHGRERRFLGSSQNPTSEKSTFGHF